MIPKLWPAILLLALWPVAGRGAVVINEIMYHAPDDLEDLEYVELHNSGDQAVDLGGWAFTKGIKFKFGAGTRIEAKGFLVLCRNADRFKEFYGAATTAGVFNEPLSNKGERIELADPSGKVVDAVKYKDSPPWPTGADGFSGSLERICPDASGEEPSNWASSPLSENRNKPAGTPGRANANFSAAQVLPVISNVNFTPENPSPNQPITVEADVRDGRSVTEVNLLYRFAGPGFEKPEMTVAMNKMSEGHYAGTIPGQAPDQLIRFRIQATGASGARRFFPMETEPRPALSSYVHGSIEPAQIPFGWIINTSESEFKAAQQRINSPGFGGFGGFGPGMFGGRGRGGPPGPGGPGGFDAEEQARARARTALERGLDYSSVWFDLTINGPTDFLAVQTLKPVLIAKVSERDKVIDNVFEGSKVEEKLKTLPDVMQTLRLGLVEALKPNLNAEQTKILAAWLEKQQQPSGGRGPQGMVTSRVNLEGAWYAVSVQAEIDEVHFGKLQRAVRELAKERNALIEEAARGQGQDDGFRELRDRADDHGGKLVAKLKPLLSPAQEKQFADWQRGPNAMVAARGGGPGGFGAGPGGFPGGPGGPGGFPGGRGGFGGPRGFRTAPTEQASSRSAFVYFDPATQKLELFDFVQVAPRKGGQKVHFYKDRPLNRMTTINLIFEGESAALAESLAYEVYRKAGMAAEQSYHVRLWINGQPCGYQLLVEQPNRAFLRRNNVRDDGNLYKILWYERGVVGQHEKKTRVREGHDDVVALIDALEKTSGQEQWEVIKKNFDVEQVVNYFAVNTVLSHWDGFFNNYFTYHDANGTGKWTMYLWDQDNTWGIGMMGRGEVFANMPITFGMNGDVPPGRPAGAGQERGFGFRGGAGWWRQPGWFSGPLLANPQFRKLFLARTKAILQSIYTEEMFGPIINGMGERLKPEVRIRAALLKTDPERAIQNLEQNLLRLREHVKKRPEFLLAQEEIKSAAKFSRADLDAISSSTPQPRR